MASCKDCIHSGICAIQIEPRYILNRRQKLMRESNNVEHECLSFKDRSRSVELPCKVGEIVYMITQQIERVGRKKVTNNVIIEFCVDNFRIGDAGYPSAALCDNENNWCYGIMPEMFGTIVFFTRKEAEQALKERES